MKWTKDKTNKCITFTSQMGDECIHIIKTGFQNYYMVVWEDAHELSIGSTEFGTKDEIETRFNIRIDI